jgi:asparagine synthase (glutamine-hydrolysing)
VALSGLGGDELFAGYPSFRRALRVASLMHVPSAVRRAAAALTAPVLGNSVSARKASRLLRDAHDPEDVYSITREVFAPDEIRMLIGRDYSGTTESTMGDSDPVNEMSRLELNGYMTSTLLRDTDQMSMAHGLEVRVPFVDRIITSLVLSMPGTWKIDGRRPKPLLLDAMGDLLPRESTHRKKMGFTLPFERWMRSKLQQDIDAMLASTAIRERSGLQPFAHDTWSRFCSEPRHEKWTRPWTLYVLARWCEINQVSV